MSTSYLGHTLLSQVEDIKLGEEKAEDSGTDDSKDSGAVSMGGVCQCLDNVDIILIVSPDSLIADRLSL